MIGALMAGPIAGSLLGGGAMAAGAGMLGGASAMGGMGAFGQNLALAALSGLSSSPDQQFPSQSPMGGGGAPTVRGGQSDFTAGMPGTMMPAYQGMLPAFIGGGFNGGR